jgi:hypothetical protein
VIFIINGCGGAKMIKKINDGNRKSYQIGELLSKLPKKAVRLGTKLKKWYHTMGSNGYVPKVDINSMRMEDE